MNAVKSNYVGEAVGTCISFVYGLIGGTDLINALLLGAAGYVGSYAAKYLHAKLRQLKE